MERGITDTVDHYVPGPFVEVRYTAFTASDGKAFASTSAARRPYNYQAGVKARNGGLQSDLQFYSYPVHCILLDMLFSYLYHGTFLVEICFRQSELGTFCSSGDYPNSRMRHKTRPSAA